MNGKKVQANMQINVGFVANTTDLVKKVENQFKQINLSSSLFSGVSTGLEKNFKEIKTNLEKMMSGLGKRGLSARQYENIFSGLNDNILRATENIKKLGDELTKAFNSDQNKENLKNLKEQQKVLEEITKLSTKQKTATTRKDTNARKAREEFGLDFDNKVTKDILDKIIARRANKQGLSSQQQKTIFGSFNEEELKRIITLYKQYNTQLKVSDDLLKEIQQKGQGKGSNEEVIKGVQEKIDKLERETIVQKDLNQITKEYQANSESLYSKVTPLAKEFNNELNETTESAEKMAKAGATLREIFSQFGIVFSAATVVRAFKQLVKTSFDFYRSLDSALNEIYVVSNLTSGAVNNLTSNFINMAKETGMSIDDVTRAAVLFYQQGLNTDEVMEMTNVTAQFAKVAGIDATDAADKLTAAVNGYRLSAEDAMSVADKFNKVAAASAADINELSTAFSKAAAQANQAGVSMDNYLAYIATMEEATREAPENLGTSLKTIFSRMQQVNSGESDDGTDINKVETALKNVGIALRDTKGQLKDLEEIFAELGPMWNTLDRNTQAYLGTIIAGTRQQSRFITLMQNWDRVLELSEESANSAGQQALMHAKAMDSIESKMQQFKVGWQEFVSNISDSDAFKGLIDFGTKFIQLLNSGTRPVALLSAGIAVLAANSKNLFAALGQNIKKGWNTLTSPFMALTPEGKNKKLTQLDDQLQQQRLKTQELSAQVAYEGESDRLNKEILRSKREEIKIQEKITKLEAQNTISTREKVGQMATTVGVLIATLGTALGEIDENLSGVVTTTGTAISAIGMAMINNWPGAIMAAVAAGYQLVQVIAKWDDNKLKKIEDSMNKISQSLSDYNNENTKINNSQKLIDRYTELNAKIYKTKEEQEELNKVVQQLGDTHGIDVISDAYGNLSINIQAVKEDLADWETKRQDLLEKLQKTENDNIMKATSGGISLDEALKRSLSSNGSEYRTLLSGLNTTLINVAGETGKTMAQSLSTNLKTGIMTELKDNSLNYAAEGLGNAALRINREINEAFADNTDALIDLYDNIEFLQQNIDDMTYTEAQEHLQDYWDKWHNELKFTEEEWRILTNTINNTVFENNSLNDFINKVQKLRNSTDSSYTKKDLKQQEERLRKVAQDYFEAGTGYDEKDVEDYVKRAKQGKIIGNRSNGFNDFIRNITFDGGMNKYAKQLDLAVKAYQEKKKEYEDFLAKYAKENGFNSTKEAEQAIEAMNVLADSLEAVSSATYNYLGSIDSLYDVDSLGTGDRINYANSLALAIDDMESLGPDASDADRYDILARFYEKNKDHYSEEVQKVWEDTLEDAYNNLKVPSPKTLAQIGKELDSLGSQLVSMNGLIDDFNSSGGLDLDSFIELGGIIDSINLADIGALDPSAIDDYINAIDKLNLAYDENTGYITMNGEALNTLQDIQEMQVKAKIKGMADDLRASAATTETQLAYIDAQIKATESTIKAIQTEADGYGTAEEIKEKATAQFQSLFNKSIDDIQDRYEIDLTNQGKWSGAILKNLSALGKAWGKYYQGIRDHSISSLNSIEEEARELSRSVEWAAIERGSGIDWDNYQVVNNSNRQELVNELNDYLESLKNSRAEVQATLTFTQKQINLLDKMAAAGTDLSKLGTSKSSSSQEKMKQYIGKLKEIYNILNRIALLEHREDMLNAYADIEEEELYGKHLKERININNELLDQYDFLVREQKQWTNGYKEFIEQSSVADVFDFDEFGQIIINFEKYNKLQDQAVSGEKSLKEQADDLYSTYTSMYDELQDDVDNYIKTLKKAIDYQREVYDAYIDTEHDLANAVKEIYQEILDTKLEAIDKEIKALEDLRKAREQANKETKDSKEVAGIQSDIQRAMMDTSGASATALIKAQANLDDKLDAIAEDKYSEMLDNITQKLEEEKETLQEEFNEMFDDLTWLFEWLESSIMSDRDGIRSILMQTQDWRQQTEAERLEDIDLWNTRFEKYITEVTGEEGKTITDVVYYIDELQRKTAQIDDTLREQGSKVGAEVAAAIANGIQTAYNNGVAAGSGSGSGGSSRSYSGSSSSSGNTNKINTEPSIDNNKKEKNIPASTFEVGKKVKSAEQLKDGGLNWVMTYKGIENDKVTEDWPIVGWPSILSGFSGDDTKIVQKKYVNGTWYYLLKGLEDQKRWFSGHQLSYKTGGLARFTGPAWLDGTSTHPEAVLDALQTKHFIDFTNTLDKMYGQTGVTNSSSVTIDNISFNVESMSSPEDGEKAFSAFVNKFNEIGSQTGIKFNTFKNTL